MKTQKTVFVLITAIFGLVIITAINNFKVETIFPAVGNEFRVEYINDGYLSIATDKGVLNVSEDDMALKVAATGSPEYILLLSLFDDNYFVITVALHNRH